MKRLGAVLHFLVSTEAITVADADRVWDAALGDLRDVEVVSQGISTGVPGSRLGGGSGAPTS